jgi:hypothetical protein
LSDSCNCANTVVAPKSSSAMPVTVANVLSLSAWPAAAAFWISSALAGPMSCATCSCSCAVARSRPRKSPITVTAMIVIGASEKSV